MENQFQKVVNVSYLVFSALLAFILLTGMMKLSAAYDLESKIHSIEYVIRGLSIVVGFASFFILYRNSQVNGFMNEVASELLTKVSWPTGRETMAATVVVIITVSIAGVVLGLFDWFWAMVLKWVL